MVAAMRHPDLHTIQSATLDECLMSTTLDTFADLSFMSLENNVFS